MTSLSTTTEITQNDSPHHRPRRVQGLAMIIPGARRRQQLLALRLSASSMTDMVVSTRDALAGLRLSQSLVQAPGSLSFMLPLLLLLVAGYSRAPVVAVFRAENCRPDPRHRCCASMFRKSRARRGKRRRKRGEMRVGGKKDLRAVIT
jgi:hypothetical protein